MKKKTQEETAEKKQQKEKKSIWQKIWKVLTVLVKILRWPVVYYGILFGGLYGFYWVFTMIQGNQPIYEVVGQYGTLLGGVLAILTLLVSLLTSSLFTETFLASTGLAAGMYLLASLFITAPSSWGTDYVDFDTMKMFVFLVLVASVLIGDIIVLVFRKVLNKRSLRHMTKQS